MLKPKTEKKLKSANVKHKMIGASILTLKGKRSKNIESIEKIKSFKI